MKWIILKEVKEIEPTSTEKKTFLRGRGEFHIDRQIYNDTSSYFSRKMYIENMEWLKIMLSGKKSNKMPISIIHNFWAGIFRTIQFKREHFRII